MENEELAATAHRTKTSLLPGSVNNVLLEHSRDHPLKHPFVCDFICATRDEELA